MEEEEDTQETKHEHKNSTILFLTKTVLPEKELGLAKIDLIMDSGANEFMVNEERFLEGKENTKTKILTAEKEAKIKEGVYGTTKNFYTPASCTFLPFGKENRCVFSNFLSENLCSVGRLCEGGFSVLFDKKRKIDYF